MKFLELGLGSVKATVVKMQHTFLCQVKARDGCQISLNQVLPLSIEIRPGEPSIIQVILAWQNT